MDADIRFNSSKTTRKCAQQCDDEQASRLAPEKRDFTATYTLGATMRQITYY